LPPHLRAIIDNPHPELAPPASVIDVVQTFCGGSFKTEIASSSQAAAGTTKSNRPRLKLSPAARRMIHHHLGLPRR
jgi:hypothetical protein